MKHNLKLEGADLDAYIAERFERKEVEGACTSDLARFGHRERGMLLDILQAWEKDGLPEGFYDDEVNIMSNSNSGCVFLTNSDYQAAMMNGDRLEIWHTCPNCGHEGFAEDCRLVECSFSGEMGCNECVDNSLGAEVQHCHGSYENVCQWIEKKQGRGLER